ncbi:dephospho-CoA kinase [Deltaproteobacteria bacterium]|nr:dephospho-CoA kinase [Deltaproteobacteria bacterium]
MITVGLTGGIACGKSTVAAILRGFGVPVLDLDEVGRHVVAPGSEGLAEVAQRWPQVVRDGALDRKALGAIVVADAEARRALEAITHPRIWAASEAWLAAQNAPAAVIEAALMVETGSYRRYDKLLVVSCRPETQRARLAAREGYDAETVERWLAAQLPLAEKERLADAIIRNDGAEAELVESTSQVWARLSGCTPRRSSA